MAKSVVAPSVPPHGPQAAWYFPNKSTHRCLWFRIVSLEHRRNEKVRLEVRVVDRIGKGDGCGNERSSMKRVDQSFLRLFGFLPHEDALSTREVTLLYIN